MSGADRAAARWKDILGEPSLLDHDGNEAIWELDTCSVYIEECEHGLHEMSLYTERGLAYRIKGYPDNLEQTVKAVRK